jgi:phage FluMu protein Com
MGEQTKCPICSKRLFDIDQYLIGGMVIKCPQCKKIIKLTFIPEKVTSTSKAELDVQSKAGTKRVT